MIHDLIERILATWPIEIAAMAYAAVVVTPIVLACIGLWLLLDVVEWLIDRADRKRNAELRQSRAAPKYRTANARQMEREIQQMWRRHPGFEHTHPTADGQQNAFNRATRPHARGRANGPPPNVMPYHLPQPDPERRSLP